MTELTIQELTEESSNDYRISSPDNTISFTFDYAVRVANGDRPESLALYSHGHSIGSVAINNIDEPLRRINEILLDTASEVTQDDL